MRNFMFTIVSIISMHIIVSKTIAEPMDFTSIVFIAKLCSWRQSQNRTIFEQFYTKQFAQSMTRCSKGNVIISERQTKNIVVEVDIPCSFKSISNENVVIDNTKINNTNTFDYINEWMDYAVRKVNGSLKGLINNYKYRLMVMPVNYGVIPWHGLGAVGGVYSWYNSHNLDISLYLHEIGHNFGFGHSMRNGEEYGDDSCVMGRGYNCYTSPHRHFMMWDQPTMTFNWLTNNSDASASYNVWNTTILLKKSGEYVVMNDEVYIESNQYSVNAYILQSNMSTDIICRLGTSELESNMCIVTDHNVTITVIDSSSDAHLISINAGYISRQEKRVLIPKNSASSTVIYIYEMICISFITYNIATFLITLL
jgi:hypothetical protein